MNQTKRRSNRSPVAPLAALRRLLGAGALLAVACGGGEDGSASPGADSQGGSAGAQGGSGQQGGAGSGGGGGGGSAGKAGSSAGTSGSAGAAASAGNASASGAAGSVSAGGQSGAAGSLPGGAAGAQATGGTAATGGQMSAGGAPAGGQAGEAGAATGGQSGTAGAGAGAGGVEVGGQAGSMAAGGQAGEAGSSGAGGSGAAGSGAGAGGSDGQPAPLGNDACNGYATRYWDCCKAHCAWAGNVPQGVSPVTSCNAKDEPLTDANAANTASSCDGPGPGSAYTCQSMAPWKVSDTLAYGYAAVPATGDICGRCYQVEFTGTSHNAGNDPGSAALKGKTMIVQATNIGYDVGNGQFDVLIPGGGVGAFNACSYQWGQGDLGAQYGGFLLQCKQQNPGASHEANKACVKARCDSVFQGPSLSELKDACAWFTGWYEAADNPDLRYAEVPCPDGIVQVSGVDRRPLNDVKACGGGGSSCTPEQQASCDCGWTNGGTSCGTDDGSCCWKACCGPK